MDLKHMTIQPQCYKQPPFSVEVPDSTPVLGETIPRRHPTAIDGLKFQPELGITTVFDVFLRSSEKFGNLNAVGTRTLKTVHTEVKKIKRVVDGKDEVSEKTWKYFELSEYRYLTFNEYKKKALDLGSGLRKLGLVKGDMVHLFAATR
jgi:long-chain acyl-CoA synthetase